MKLLVVTVAAMAMLVSPSLADYVVCTTSTQADTTVMGTDDPDIPNCVMNPATPYPNGICENVAQWTNYGGQTVSCPEDR